MHRLTITIDGTPVLVRECATVTDARDRAHRWEAEHPGQARFHITAQDGSTLDEWDSRPLDSGGEDGMDAGLLPRGWWAEPSAADD